ncbi:clathrin interactor EPSIN 2-like isoform X5 [Hibiscus syriacus]|uniref:clathrin interactor EPSIN 2-like isoform X5 n=1 Tax=Hibiscus syriacus TaxID=106335 RepID=UPI0019212ABC|nr:clathrin interactor EPSIN 2-like isoform X5 [Hibiscus syriacus]
MKKAIGQTVRELKREVNKKVLKVPGIEQKVLDATSNEPWGPHGSLLADIAMATRNYHEYQMIMSVIWKRLNDTGKNWRHVYKALTVLEYLVANGSERVIDDIREHSYQVSALSNFQYIDSSGRDQGNNVRKKSQSLVALVNDKERIIEVRQKAAANRDKFRNTSSGGMYRPGSGGYGDRYDYGNRDYDDQNGYGRDREYADRDDDRYGRYGDSNSRDGDSYGRDYEDRNSRDGYRDDDYRGRSTSVDDYQHGTRSRSSDRDRAFDEDGASSRGSGARGDDHSQDGRQHERKHSEQNVGAPPSYEAAANETQSPVHSERVGQTSVAAAPGASLPASSNNPNQAAPDLNNSASVPNQQVEAFDEFDPRGPVSVAAAPTTAPAAAAVPTTAVPTASTNVEMDLLDALSDSFAIVPVTPENIASESDAHANSGAMPTFAANQSTSNFGNQGFDDPFGDNPFKAVPSTDAAPAAHQISNSIPTFQPATNQNAVAPQLPANSETVANFNFGDSFSANAYSAPGVSTVQPPTNPQFLPPELSTPNQENNTLADIFPPSGPARPSASAYGQYVQPSVNPYSQQPQSGANPYGQPAQPNANPYDQPAQPNANPYGQPAQPNANPYGQPAQPNANPYGQPAQPNPNPYAQTMQPSSNNSYGNFNSQIVSMAPEIPESAARSSNGSFNSQIGSNAPVSSHMAAQPQNNNDLLGGLISQPGSKPSMEAPTITPLAGALAIVPVSQPSKDKFETKSAVWADTLSRGLVNLNISGPKTNPLADIGVDFDALNRKEKRMEKPAPNAVTSTITMGKAMGSGSGIGRSGASTLRPPANSMAGSGMGSMGMGGGPSGGMGMGGGYGGMNQQPMGMGMGMNNMGMNPGMGMNMGMGQRPYMQPQAGMPGGYNPMMGSGGYSQQPYGGGYR